MYKGGLMKKVPKVGQIVRKARAWMWSGAVLMHFIKVAEGWKRVL